MQTRHHHQALAQTSGTIVFKTPVELDLISKLEPILESQQLQLCDVTVRGGQVVIYLESADGLLGGLGIDDCERIHRLVGPMFDVWDPIPTAYTLEISTPGEHPPLRAQRHFELAMGHEVEFETTEAIPMPEPLKPRKRWKGILKAMDSQHLSIEDPSHRNVFRIPLNTVKNAVWLREWKIVKEKNNERVK